MRDFPMFTTENGVASLVLREIPYQGVAYITLQSTLEPKAFLKECVSFCKSVGAEKVFAKGHAILEEYPFHTAVWKMSRTKDGLPETDAALFPVTERTIEQWRSIYNERMKNVPNVSTMTRTDGEELLGRGGGYFVHRGDTLLGIGIVEDAMVRAVAAVKSGAGCDTMLALCNAIFTEDIYLEVASNNQPAVKLYDRLGFQKVAELSRWYDVTG